MAPQHCKPRSEPLYIQNIKTLGFIITKKFNGDIVTEVSVAVAKLTVALSSATPKSLAEIEALRTTKLW